MKKIIDFRFNTNNKTQYVYTINKANYTKRFGAILH